MENSIDVSEIMIKKLIKQYNKIADLTKRYKEPSVYDYLMYLIQNHITKFKSFKENDIVGALFMLTYDCHIDDYDNSDFYEKVLRTLRVWSKKDDIFFLMIHLYDNLGFDLFDKDDGFDFMDDELLMYKEIADDLFERFNVVKLTELPKEPFKIIMELQRTNEVDYESRNLVDNLAFAMNNTESFDYLLIYNLLYVSSYAHSTMSLLMGIKNENDGKDLLYCMVNAFEVTHEEALLNPQKDFYNCEDNNEYILSLDSLGYLCKMTGEFEEAIIHYQKALAYDKQDVLNIKASLLFPYISTENYEEASILQDTLPDESIHKNYMKLYLDYHAGMDITLNYQKAVESSLMIMNGIIKDEINFVELSPEEQSFINDFFVIFTRDLNLISKLKGLHN
ncbi:MAG: tetratricopeptide repeat protein [Candidatus Izemoplasma sp.]